MTTTALEPYESRRPRVRGLTTILTAVDHKTIGLRWIITAFTFFILAGLLALTMVTQLSQPGLGVLSSEAYNQFFTMHGMTMMFYFAVPIMLGLGIYFVPLLIGAREVGFPGAQRAYLPWEVQVEGGLRSREPWGLQDLPPFNYSRPRSPWPASPARRLDQRYGRQSGLYGEDH